MGSDKTTRAMHRLVERQLRKSRSADGTLDVDRFIRLVDAAYQEQDRDRSLAQRAVDLMSKELLELNRKIGAQAKQETAQARADLAHTRAESERLAAALDSVSDGIALFDSDDRLVTCNSAFRSRHFTVIDQLAAGRNFEDLVRAHVASGHFALGGLSPDDYVARRVSQHRAAAGLIERQLADGRWEEVLDELLPGGGWIVVISDITLRNNAEQEQIAARKAAEAANVAKSQFLANMSHELRTPLNAIIGFSELMERATFGPLGDSRYADYVSDIHHSGLHLLGVINEILDLAKVEAGREEISDEPCAVGELIDDAVGMVRELAKLGRVSVNQALAPGLKKVIVDRRKMVQILINLLSNAVKFTPAGGTITVTAWTGKNGCVVQVADTGIGMKLEDIPRAFTAFTQLDSGLNRKHEGTGLGLPLCKALIELHGGTIDLQSAPGAGTIATLRLPKSRIEEVPPSTLAAAE